MSRLIVVGLVAVAGSAVGRRHAMVRSIIRNGLRGGSRDLERHSVGIEKAPDDGREGARQLLAPDV